MNLSRDPSPPTERGERSRWVMPLVVVGILVNVLGLVAVMTAAFAVRGLWNGEPYPVASPEATAEATREHALRVHHILDVGGELPGPDEDAIERSDSSCYTRGLRAVTNWDAPEPGVFTMTQDWHAEGVSERQARSSIGRLRSTLTAEGWGIDTDTGRSSGGGSSGFLLSLSELDTNWRVHVTWYHASETMHLTVVSPCFRLPGRS